MINIAKGFQFGGTACGIKENKSLDLSMIVSDEHCVAAGVYTQNLIRAASIDWNRNVTPSASVRAVITNSGNANACTGSQGEQDCKRTAEIAAEKIGCGANQVIVLSTGVIGHFLPMDKIETGISQCKLGHSEQDFLNSADAILTTDNSRKTASVSTTIDGYDGMITGMAKGAGMIGPNMATMLSVITTDFRMSASTASQFLTEAVNRSFNRISVEGHTSTNDAVVLLASGIGPDVGSSQQFADSLQSVCLNLAKQIPADGEGATKLIEIRVSGAVNDNEAEKVARKIAESALVKTAVTGCDPNWGRIVSAAGYAGAEIQLQQMSLRINDVCVFEKGGPCQFDEAATSQIMVDADTIILELAIGGGDGKAVHWTSNLTADYVRINSEYRT